MINQLFNQAILDKYSDIFNLTDDKIQIINEYLSKLDHDGFRRERSNYTYFYIKVLKGILGYEIDESVDQDVPSDHGSGVSEFILKKENKKFLVIELKKQNQNLDEPQPSRGDRKTPIQQAFDYARDNDDVDWILVSNFDEYRLYNWEKKKNKYISFKFEELLNPKCFQYFMLVLSFKSHEEGLINRLMETISVDWEFEENFYNLYHQTRLMLIKELQKQEFSNKNAIHYAQMILNRYIFICFAEDTGLITPETSKNTIISTLGSGRIGRDNIWKVLNDLFLDLNEGSPNNGIMAFNGGLFNENLSDSGVIIRDYVERYDFIDIPQKWDFEEYENAIKEEILERVSPLFQHRILEKINPIFINLLIIARFNFKSQVDVNILGHIFENSIDDLEQLQDENYDLRRSGGIYYTPEYITDFICRNTIIPYLSKTGNSCTVDDLIAEYLSSEIDDLDTKIQNIKILDPSCGSGAFLNKASDIFVEIHEGIHKEKYKNDHTLDPHFDNLSKRKEVLKNNIFGVDINRESVEITKLSLFLKIAHKEDPELPTMDDNIKCGNSLLDESEFTETPFSWRERFEPICNEGGFDIIVGNPPYVSWSKMEEREYFEDGEYLDLNFHCRPNHDDAHPNIYLFFLLRSIKLLKNDGYLSFILPHEWLYNSDDIRDYILQQTGNIHILKFHPNYRVFKKEKEDIGTNSLIVRFDKSSEGNFFLAELNELDEGKVRFFLKRFNLHDIFTKNIMDYNLSTNIFNKSRFFGLRWETYSDIVEDLLERTSLTEKFISFSNNEYFSVIGGFQPNVEFSRKFIITKNEISYLNDFEKENVFPCIYNASEIKRYILRSSSEYWIVLNGLFESESEFEETCPNLHQILLERLGGSEGKWWNFPNVRNLPIFRNATEKIISPRTASKNSFCFDNERHIIKGTNSCIISTKFNLKFVLGILNSDLAAYWYREYGYSYHGGQTKKYEPAKIKKYMLPVIIVSKDDENYIISRVDGILDTLKLKIEIIDRFRNWLIYKLRTSHLSNRIDEFYKLNLDEFRIEIENLNQNLNVDDLDLISNKFNECKSNVNQLISKYIRLNNEINIKVYNLYGIIDNEKTVIDEYLNRGS